jgi:Kef-type K+ transport system membrane component KefB
MRPQELVAHSRDALLVAIGGMVLPLACGLALTWWVLPPGELRLAASLAVGVALATTAVPVTARILMDAGLLHDRIGQTIVSAAIFDDVLGLVLLSILTALIETGEIPTAAGVAMLLGRVVLFFAIALVVNGWLLPRLSRKLGWKVSIDDDLHTLLMVSFGYAVLAELLGMHFILGPFMVGLFCRQGERPESYEEVKSAIGHISGAFLSPIFFASIGLQLDLTALTAVPGFLAALVALEFLGKLVGASLPARLSGLSRRESLAVGVGMSGRGVVVLIVANLFSALVITAIVTTIATPMMLRLLLPGIRAERAG